MSIPNNGNSLIQKHIFTHRLHKETLAYRAACHRH